jgi:ribosomal protein L31E
MRTSLVLALFALISPSIALADEPAPAPAPAPDCVPPPGGKCLNSEQFEEVKKALKELEEIHKSPAVVTTDDKISIISDWDGRVYVNGGSNVPLKMRVKVGSTVDREMSVILPTSVNYRPKPPDPL